MEPTRQPDPTLERERWRKIESIYVAALSRPPAERAQFVDEACRGDEPLKRIVDSLVEHADDAKGFMEAPAIDLAAQIARDEVTRASEIRRLGAYHLGALIGAGGMGEVYRGRDSRLGRDVAIKLLPASMGHDPHRLERFEREARLLAALNHPNIASVYEFEEAEGVHGLVMELVEGPTLADRIAEGPLPLAQALPIAAQVADAVHTAHIKGIIHRDLKPANIKASPLGPVKVLDFGLAKMWSDAAPVNGGRAAAPLTIGPTGDHVVLLGTPAYMSPEQAQGKSVDIRTDVWAFGCVVYEMLTGVSAFSGNSTFETITRVLEQEPDWRLLPGDTPAAIRELLANCLDKHAERRLTDLATARLVIQGCINDLDANRDPTPGRNTARAPRTKRRGKPPERAAVAAAIFAVMLVGLVAVRIFPMLPPLSQPALAFKERDWILIADFENLTGDEVFDRSLRAALEVGIAQSQFVNVFPSGRVQDALRRMQKPATDALTESLAVEVAVREGIKGVLAGTVAEIGNTYSLTARLIDPQTRLAVRTASRQAKGKNEVLSALGELSVELRRNLGESLSSGSPRGTPLPQATTFSLEALKMYADSFKLTALNSLDEGQRLLREAIALDPDFALAHAELGRRYYLKSESAVRRLGEEHFVKALALLDRLSPRERLWIPAIAEDARGNRQSAVDAYKAYLAQYPDDARAWFRLGWTEMAALGHFDPAIQSFARALALNPSDTSARVNLATCYSGAGKYREAAEEYRRSFELEPALLMAYFVNHEFGFTLVRLGELDAAADVFKKMTTDPEPAKQARGHRSLALLLMYKGQYTAGISELRRAASINHTMDAGVSEVADRLFLVRALAAKGLTAEVKSELATLDALAARMSLAPGWLSLLAKLHARNGQVARARALLPAMSGASADATADSYANRDRGREQANVDLARGEVALAEGNATEAVERLESACLLEPLDGNMIESLAAALAAAGRLQDAAKRYEQLIAMSPLGTHAQEQWLAAHVRLGAIDERLGRADAARQLYERLLKILTAADTGLVLANEARSRSVALSHVR